jgi:hypothetical protein
LKVPGDAVDTNTVGFVGYPLGKNGYPTAMSRDSLACSPEPEIRRIAVSLIPWLTDGGPEPLETSAYSAA